MSTASPPFATGVDAFSSHIAAAIPNAVTANATAPVSSILAEVFHLCQQQWVHNFLFTAEMSPLAALTAPLSQQSAMACSLRFDNVSAANFNTSSPSPFNLQISGEFVFIPAFSAGSLGVGFGVHKVLTCKTSDKQLLNVCGTPDIGVPNHFRFVRDDASSLLIIVYEEKSTDTIKIEYMKNITNTTRRRAFICLSRSALQPFLDARAANPSSTPPSPPLSAVLVCESGTETRECLTCNSQRGVWCDCPLEKPIPTHPFDFEATRRCMVNHTGSFEGVANTHFCPSTPSARSTTMGARIFIKPRPNDFDLVDRFTRWAIADQLVVKPMRSPSLPAIPGALLGDVDSDHVVSCPPCSDTTNSVKSDLLSSPGISASPQSPSPPSQSSFPPSPSTITLPDALPTFPSAAPSTSSRSPTRPIVTRERRESTTPSMSLFENGATPSVSLDAVALDSQLDISALLQETLESPENNLMLSNTDVSQPSMKSQAPTIAAIEIQDPPIKPEAQQTKACMVEMVREMEKNSSGDNITSSGSSIESLGVELCADNNTMNESCDGKDVDISEDEDETRKESSTISVQEGSNDKLNGELPTSTVRPAGVTGKSLLVLQPRAAPVVLPRPAVAPAGINMANLVAGIPPFTVGSGAQSTSNAGISDGDRERRAQLRRQRNREAAQRSNLRRKVRNDTLKKNLRESQSRAAELRARELLLREENLKLRKLLP